MKIISAIGTFKGTIDSVKINNLVKTQLEKAGHQVTAIPVADGGDGLLQSITASIGGEIIEIDTFDALGRNIKSKIAVKNDTGIVEMALASGIAILKEDELNPMQASTYGTGVMIRHLANIGVKNIILGIGGSATNDAGMGCLNALGFSFYDKLGNYLVPCGENLKNVSVISDTDVSEKIKALNIKIACDVSNPLLGENGATYVYSAQKGADKKMQKKLESGMRSFADIVEKYTGLDYSYCDGAGAAGGLGFGLMALLGASLQKGAEIVLQYAQYEKKLENTDLVITGEGRIDNQTLFGKLPQIVASKAKEKGVRCIAIVGSSTADKKSLADMGISKAYELVDFAPIERCMNDTENVIKECIEKF